MGSDASHRFGPFRLDTRSRILTRDGAVVPLAPRTLDLLLVFVTSGGRLLTKDELLRVVWGDVHVEEASLAFQVSTLRKALGEHGPVWIETVPKHGYRFTGPVVTQPADVPVAQIPVVGTASGTPIGAPPRLQRRQLGWVVTSVGLLILLAAAGAIALRRADVPTADPTPHIRPITSYPGMEIQPGLSPDGTQVAFAWEGDRKDFGIYVQLVGQDTPVPLTRHPAPEYSPVWSPDGRLIAFCRQTTRMGSRLDSGDAASEIVVVPFQGGPERIVARRPDGWIPGCDARVPTLSWFPSSDALAVVGLAEQPGFGYASAIYVVPLDGGPSRRLTSPPPATWGDALPSVSADGRYLAFTRSPNQFWVSGAIHIVRLNRDRSAAGEPERLMTDTGEANARRPRDPVIAGLGWLPGRDEVLFSGQGLWAVPLGGRREPRLVPTPGHGPGVFSISRDGKRLAFSRGSVDLDIWRMPGPASIKEPRAVPADGQSLIATTRMETNPQYSPDGKRIAFTSQRTGSLQIWVADADGANAVQVTSSEAFNGSPRWSPDGRYLAYDEVAGGKGDIIVIPAGGGPVRRVTPPDSHEHLPSWSADGRWIYYESDRTGELQLWKSEFPSGAAVQVTNAGGAAAFESPDGQWVYYGKRGQTGLWRKPVPGGDEERISEHGHPMFWGPYDEGACTMDPLSEDVTVECFEFESMRFSTVARFPNQGRVRPTGPSLGISPDGRWILYTRIGREEADLMLVDQFDDLSGTR
jgi:Tol biopolymer transport system component/DNA-binding winged helix-turn-helix (wHTH) protein